MPDPVCWAEAPGDLRTLGRHRHRRRWQRGLFEALWRHRALIGRPSYGVLGLVAIPYFVFFELIGPLFALTGYVATPLAFALGLLSLTFLLAFGSMAILLGALLSISALALEEFSFRRHQRGRDVARMLVLSVVENFGYRQLNDLWRALAFVDLARRRRDWGAQKRRGLGAPTSGEPALDG